MEEQEEKRKILRIILSFLFFLLVLFLLGVYWLIPFRTFEFKTGEINNNFSLNNTELKDMQFYEKMRYPDSSISYKILDCTLKKQKDMKKAFEIIEEKTILNFYPVENNAEIEISCDEKMKIEGDLFIAGEGGPVNITQTDNFNVIIRGKVLLIENSRCPNPNVAIHELLHALGFKHSENSESIMYSITKCSQNIGKDIPDLINELYSYESLPDLSIKNATAFIHSRYLDINTTIKNNGLKKSKPGKLSIYADEEFVKDFDIETLEVGYERTIILKNILVNKRNLKKLGILIDLKEKELNKKNNKISLENK